MAVSRIFEEFSRVEYGAALPREGDLNFFYDNFADVGMMFVKEDDRYHVFYVDHEDIIEEINDTECRWIVESGGPTIVLALLKKIGGDFFRIPFMLSSASEDYAAVLHQFIGEKRVMVHFLSFLYGELYKSRSLEFGLPDNICDELSKVLESA